MGAIKRGNKWWVSFRFGRMRYRKASPENSRAGAQAYEAVLRQKLSMGEPLEEKKKEAIPNFKAFVAQWMDSYVLTNNKPSEIKTKKTILNHHLIPAFGNLSIDKINTLDVENYKSQKTNKGLKHKTINNP